MPRLLHVSVIALAASLALAGCSSTTSASSSQTSSTVAQASESSGARAVESNNPQASDPGAAPASGDKITGSGYSIVVPEGWTKPDQDPAQQGLDVVVVNRNDTDGFADNVNVLLSPAGKVTPEQVESQGVKEIKDAGATDVVIRPRTTVAGSESAHLSAMFSHSGAKYQIEQFYQTHGEQTFITTFSFSTTVSQADRDALCDSVLKTWSWA